jgi:hypothetical protein
MLRRVALVRTDVSEGDKNGWTRNSVSYNEQPTQSASKIRFVFNQLKLKLNSL